MSALILMSTYQGERYLATQLDSILAQTYSNWTIVIRDDGSTDNTLSIIRQYQAQGVHITLLEDQAGNLTACGSFAALMQFALTQHHDYIFFADQDDVWLPDKLEKSIQSLQQLTAQHGADKPALVHTDLQVVNEHLHPIHPSFLHYERLTPRTSHPLRTLLINNYVTGCTVGINRALLHVATPVPTTAMMHDWWLALCAASMGHMTFLNEATMLYRQHAKNAIGSRGLAGKMLDVITLKRGLTRQLTQLRRCFYQAQSLLNRIDQHHPAYSLITRFANMPAHSFIGRYLTARAIQLYPAGHVRHLVFLVMLGWV